LNNNASSAANRDSSEAATAVFRRQCERFGKPSSKIEGFTFCDKITPVAPGRSELLNWNSTIYTAFCEINHMIFNGPGALLPTSGAHFDPD